MYVPRTLSCLSPLPTPLHLTPSTPSAHQANGGKAKIGGLAKKPLHRKASLTCFFTPHTSSPSVSLAGPGGGGTLGTCSQVKRGEIKSVCYKEGVERKKTTKTISVGPKLLPLMDRKSGRCPLQVRICGEQWQYNVEGYFAVPSRKNITVQLFVRRLVGLIYVAKRVPPAASRAGGSPFEDVFGLFVAGKHSEGSTFASHLSATCQPSLFLFREMLFMFKRQRHSFGAPSVVSLKSE